MFVEEKAPGEVEVKPLDYESTLLLKAADYIEEHGWCQRRLQFPDGRVCMVGALEKVGQRGDIPLCHTGAWERLQDAFDGCAGTWNDRPERTQAEVVAKLRSIALGG